MTAENLMPFFKVLPEVEQQKFIKLVVAKIITPEKMTSAKKQKAILTGEEAIQYLITKYFKRLV